MARPEETDIRITRDIAKARRFALLEAARAFIATHNLEGAACVPTASDPATGEHTEWAVTTRAYIRA